MNNDSSNELHKRAICKELLEIAEQQQREIEYILPTVPIHSLTMLIHILRARDYWETTKVVYSLKEGISVQELDIMRMGCNLAISYLYKAMHKPGFPMQEFTKDNKSMSETIMYKLGCTTMIKRVVEMVKADFLTVTKENNTYIFKKQLSIDAQFLDELEFYYFKDIQEELSHHKKNSYKGWQLIDVNDYQNIKDQPGYFLGFKNRDKAKINSYLRDDIDELMKPLVRRWDSGHGLMIAYDTTPEIDYHFLAIAMNLFNDWRSEAGFHPEIKLGDVKGADINEVMLVLVSLHLKHIRFTTLAYGMFKDINIGQTLTIWEPLDQLVNGIADFIHSDRNKVRKAIEAIMLNAEDAESLRNFSSRFMPPLISLGNGYILRPVTSIVRNPFFSIISLLEQRNDNIRHNISAPREAWARDELYAMFQGTRYQRVEGNIKLRQNKNILTDIDACIYDNMTGELALFQIKWQDFFYNDVKKLRSKASNLAREMDEWAEKVMRWISANGNVKLGKSIRLKYGRENFITSVYLFGLSRNVARVEGYGYSVKSTHLAVTNWPRFQRYRAEMSPSPTMLSTLFNSIIEDTPNDIQVEAMPFELKIDDYNLKFEDLYVVVPENVEK